MQPYRNNIYSMNKYNLLALKLKTGGSSAELKKAMTHKSFYKKDDESQGNSRYVFGGMFAFKGEVAQVLLRFVSGTGTQLQHALGKMFKTVHMESLFAYFDLGQHIRHGTDFDAAGHRHIFVFGLLGWLIEHASEEVRKEFITRHFILPFSNELVPPSKNRDMEAQCNVLARTVYGCKVKLTVQESEEGFQATASAGSDRVLAVEHSVSYRYSRHKALKKALHALMDAIEEQDRLNPAYELQQQRLNDILLQKQEAEKAEKASAYAEKLEQKKKERQEKKARQKEQAMEADIKRRKSKANAKLRKEQEAQRAAETAAKMSGMSANKRRHLQDKAK